MSAIRVALGILTLAIAGFLIPQTIDNGVGKFRDDPIQYRVAMNSLQAYWTLNHNSVARFIWPGATVRRVWVVPGHCRDPRARDATVDYRAEVQGLSWFGIRGPIVDVTCGGKVWARRK